jgi:hypothetical protein
MIKIKQRDRTIQDCDRRITNLGDIDISFGLFTVIYLLIWVIVNNTVNVKDILKIYLIERKIYPNH